MKIKKILITAGPTREKIDPVRFISNYSTGTFGYEIAKEAKRRSLSVTLISGPASLKRPLGVRVISVESSGEMKRAVLAEFADSDCLIMAAAVADWKPKYFARRKMKRGPKKIIELVENPDILAEVGAVKKDRVVAGFALETENLERNALKKLKDKNLDLIIANRLGRNADVFGDNTIDIVMMDRFGNRDRICGKSKRELAKIILNKVLSFRF